MDDNGETFVSWLSTELPQAPPIVIAFNLIVAALLGMWIGRFYVRYGTALSNRRSFAKNFILLSMTTALIISVIQSNVALSLGMIGALSIVRFRSAIKEPEELAYLFLSIAAGMGLGAGDRLGDQEHVVTICGVAMVLLVLWFKAKLDRDVPEGSEQNLYLTVVSSSPEKVSAKSLQELLASSCALYRLKRLDQTKSTTEACYLIEPKDETSMSQFETEVRKLDNDVTVSLLDTRGGLMGAGG